MPYILGLLIGSFLNVCIYRIPREESIVTTPSHCIFCHNKLKWYDLFPVISYMLLRGRCRICNNKISVRYPLIELTNMIAYGVIWHYLGYSINMIIGCTLFSTLLVISIIDIKHYIIPNGLTMFLFIVGIIYSIMANQLLYGSLGFIIGSIPLILIYIISNNKIGGGDIKLLAVSGWFIGWKNVLLSLFLASIVGSIISIFFILIKLNSKEDKIPFAPYLSLAIIITFFYGKKLIEWYLYLFI